MGNYWNRRTKAEVVLQTKLQGPENLKIIEDILKANNIIYNYNGPSSIIAKFKRYALLFVAQESIVVFRVCFDYVAEETNESALLFVNSSNDYLSNFSMILNSGGGISVETGTIVADEVDKKQHFDALLQKLLLYTEIIEKNLTRISKVEVKDAAVLAKSIFGK